MTRLLPATLAAILVCSAALAQEEFALLDAADLALNEPLTIELPGAASEADGPVCLAFEARIQTRYATGSAAALQVAVNGLPTSIERLRNKPQHYLFSGGRRVGWYSSADAAWVLPYYAWDRQDVAEGQAHEFVLDVTNLIRPADNTVTFESIYDTAAGAIIELRRVALLLHSDFPKSPALDEPQVVSESHGIDAFRERATGYHSGAEAQLNTEIAWRPDAGEVLPTASYAQGYELALSGTGRIIVTVGGDRYEAYSWFGAGGGVWRTIGQEPGGGWDALGVDGTTVTCASAALSLERSVLRRDSHVEVRDTVRNLTGGDLALPFVNAVDVGSVAGVREFRISGQLQRKLWANTKPQVGRQLAATPVVYVERAASAVGLVMEDDAYRNQGSVLCWDGTVATGDGMFYLQPGAQYTFVWKIFPLAKPGYYALTNAIRADWSLYQRIPGLFGFVHPHSDQRMYEDVRCEGPEQVAQWLGATGIEIASTVVLAPEDAEGSGPTLYGNERMQYMRAGTDVFLGWRDAVREFGADPACLPYMDVHLCRLVGETLEEMRERLPGCLIEDAWGDPVAYRTGWLYNVLPTLDNASGRHLLDVMRYYVDDAGFDGMYFDEWDHSRARVSFAHEDGLSALLTDQGAIARKVGIVPIMAKSFQLEMTRELVERDAIIFANQFDDTLDAAQLPICHFAEPYGSHDSYLLAAAQLSRTPLALHVKATRGVWGDAIAYLKRGLLMCYYWKFLHGDHLLKRCYPITVREIRPGVVIGEDRIVTCSSGTFSLGGDDPLVAYVYAGPDGELARTVEGQSRIEGHAAVEVNLATEEAAVVMAVE